MQILAYIGTTAVVVTELHMVCTPVHSQKMPADVRSLEPAEKALMVDFSTDELDELARYGFKCLSYRGISLEP